MAEGSPREVLREKAPLAGAPWVIRWLVRTIDGFTDWTGKAVAWLTALPLVFVIVYEVILRYAFNDPTIWAFDVSYMLYGSLFMLGAAFTLLHQGHIRTDIFYGKWSPRVQGLVD